MKALFAILFLAVPAVAAEMYFDIYVPGESDVLYVDGARTNGTGTLRNLVASLPKTGEYQYKFQVDHDGVSVTRLVYFTGSEGRMTIYFLADEFDSAKIVKLPQAFRNSFRSQDPKRVDAARQALRQSEAVLDAMIARSESAAFWRTKLRWAELTAQMDSQTPDAGALDNLYRGLFFAHQGMEYPEVQSVREALREFRDAVTFAGLRNGEAKFRQTLDEMIPLIQRFEGEQRAEDRIELGKRVAWLEQGRLAPTLVSAIRSRFARRNSVTQFNVKILEKFAYKKINQTKSGVDLILGTPTSSTSSVDGYTYILFRPCETHAEIQVGMSGVMTSESYSSGGARGVSVSVNGTSQNQVHVYRRVTVTELAQDKIVLHPPGATVDPITSSASISSSASPILPFLPRGLQFIRNKKEQIGYETASSRLPAGQAEGRRIAAEKLAAAAANEPLSLPAKVKNVLDQFQGVIKEFIHHAQQRGGVYPRDHWLATDDTWLYVKHIRRTQDELAAFTPPPAFRTKNVEAGFRLHESEITNIANWQLSGDGITDGDVQGFTRSVFNYVPPILRLGTHAPRWKATLIDDHPFVLDFENDRAVLVIRFKKLEIGAKVIDTPFAVRVVYRFQKTDAPMLERLEEATITGEPSIELVEFLQPRIQAFFKEAIYFDGLTPIRGGIFEPLTKTTVREFRTENNWLLVGLTLDGDLLEILKATPSGLGGDDKVIQRK